MDATNDDEFVADLDRELDAGRLSVGQLFLAIAAWATLVTLWCWSQTVTP